MTAIPDEVFSKPHRLTMGLRSLDLVTWLDAGPHEQLPYRTALLAERRSEVYQLLPEGHEAGTAVAQAVAGHVGSALPGADDPLVEAAQLVRDDLCVLAHQNGGWHLVAAVVCFPSRWRLADKMGRDVMAIHDPVPGYRANLEAPTRKVFDGLTARWRLNWTLLDDPELFQPAAPSGSHRPGLDSYLRVERQCLVPVGDHIAFTIRTDVVALADLAPERAEAILTAAAAAPPELAAYRGWTE